MFKFCFFSFSFYSGNLFYVVKIKLFEDLASNKTNNQMINKISDINEIYKKFILK